MQTFKNQNEISFTFEYDKIVYDINLSLEEKKSDNSVLINGRYYNIDCKNENPEVPIKIFNSLKLGSVTSEEELKGRLSIIPNISFPEVSLKDYICKTMMNMFSTMKSILNSEEKGIQSFKSEFNDVQTNLNPFLFDQVFVSTNELNWKETIKFLKKEPLTGNTGIYTSGLFALDLAACERAESNLKLDNIIIVDIAPIVKDFWAEMEYIIKNIDNRFTAKKLIKNLIQEKQKIYFPENSSTVAQYHINSIENSFTEELSFLSSDEKYEKIRKIFTEDRFVFILVDLFDQNKLHKLGDTLKKNSCTIDTLYISNIYGLVSNELQEKYEEKGKNYEYQFTLELLQELANRNDPRMFGCFELTFHEKMEIFENLYVSDIISKEEFLLKVEKGKKIRDQSCNDKSIKLENQCKQFVTSVNHILGEFPGNTNLIHASRTCDQGCCVNPQRIDKTRDGNIAEILTKKTPCNVNK